MICIFSKFYTDEDLKWDNPPVEDCLLIHLSVTVALPYFVGRIINNILKKMKYFFIGKIK